MGYGSCGVKDSSEQGLLLVLGTNVLTVLITNLVVGLVFGFQVMGKMHVVHDVLAKITWVYVSRLLVATPRQMTNGNTPHSLIELYISVLGINKSLQGNVKDMHVTRKYVHIYI